MQSKHVSMAAMVLAGVVLVSGAAASDRDQSASSMQNAQLVRADQLIGTAVLDPQGEKIGTVDDLLLDTRGTSVTHAVVARGGFLGVGIKRHAVRWQDLQLGNLTQAPSTATGDPDRQPTVALDATKDQFAQVSPPLDRESWREYEPEEVGGASRRVADILGSEVRGSNQVGIGEVADLVIDADHGQIAYALVDYEGTWDLDTEVLSVPWSSVNRSGSLIITSLDEYSARQLGNHDDVRVFARDEVAEAGQSDMASSHYGAEGRDGSEGRPADVRAGGTMGELITISGTIESVVSGTKASGAGAPTGVLTFRLKADSGPAVTVDAGSEAALTRQNLTLRQGDKVTVTGHEMAAGAATSGDVIMAHTIQKGSLTVQIERPGMDQTKPEYPEKTPER